jgi:hypothetical protein
MRVRLGTKVLVAAVSCATLAGEANADVIQYCTEFSFTTPTLNPPSSVGCENTAFNVFGPPGNNVGLILHGLALITVTSPRDIALGFPSAALQNSITGFNFTGQQVFLRVGQFLPEAGFVDFVGAITGLLSATSSAVITWSPGVATIGSSVFDIEFALNQTPIVPIPGTQRFVEGSVTSVVPEPSTVALVATGLFFLAGLARRRFSA